MLPAFFRNSVLSLFATFLLSGCFDDIEQAPIPPVAAVPTTSPTPSTSSPHLAVAGGTPRP